MTTSKSASWNLVKHRGTTGLSGVGNWWINLSPVFQYLAVVVLLVIKAGISLEYSNVERAYLPGSQQLPEPRGYFSTSIGHAVLARLVQADTVAEWMILHFVLITVVMAIALFLASRSRLLPRPEALLLLCTTTAIFSMLQTIGKYDPVTFLGAITLVLANRPALRILGAVIMALGNPEQALVATICVVILTYAKEFSMWRRTAWIALVVVVFIWLSLQTWLLAYGVAGSRLPLIAVFLGISLAAVVRSPLVQVWTWLGIGWFVLLGIFLGLSGRSRAIAILALVGIPCVATVTTADGARVFAMVVLPAYLIAGAWLFTLAGTETQDRRLLIGTGIVLLIMLPATIQTTGWLGDLAAGRVVTVLDPIRQFGEQLIGMLTG